MVMLIVNGMRLWWCWISICRYITVFWVGWLGGPEGSRVLFRGKIPPDHWVSGVVMREVAVLAVKAVTCCKADSSNNACPEVAWIPRALYATLDKPYWGDSAHIRKCGEATLWMWGGRRWTQWSHAKRVFLTNDGRQQQRRDGDDTERRDRLSIICSEVNGTWRQQCSVAKQDVTQKTN